MSRQTKILLTKRILEVCKEAKHLMEILEEIDDDTHYVFGTLEIQKVVEAMGATGQLITRGHGVKRTIYIAPPEGT